MITGISLVTCCQLQALQFLSLSLVIYTPSCKYTKNISWNIYKQHFILYNQFWFLCDYFGSYNNSVVIYSSGYWHVTLHSLLYKNTQENSTAIETCIKLIVNITMNWNIPWPLVLYFTPQPEALTMTTLRKW